jgi:HK97 family phage major capsid protein
MATDVPTDVASLVKIINDQGRLWEEFKSEHARQIEEIKKGRADPLLEEKIQKLSARIDELQEQKDAIEKRLNRPGTGPDENPDETKALRAFNLELKAAAIAKNRSLPAEVSVEQYRLYKRAFSDMMRKGVPEIADEERKALSIGIDSEGGYLVPADVSGRIVTKLFDLSPIRSIANIQTISSDRLEGIEDLDEASFGWVGEIQARTDTATPKIGKYEIPAHEMYAMPNATQKLLDDSAVDVEAWLSGKVLDKFARAEGAAFCTGDGINKPRGFTSYTFVATGDATRTWGQLEMVKTGVNGDFAASAPADILYDLEGAFKPGYLANARWVTRRQVVQKIRKFKGATTGDYLWQPGLQAGKPATLIGYPITMAEDMPALATNTQSLALGDFNIGYQIVDRLGIRVLRDPFTNKPYIRFYTTKRTGGAVVNFEAIKAIQFST